MLTIHRRGKYMSKRILLLSCCAPCSCAVIEKLHNDGENFAVAFYNPNIHPKAEYIKRKNEQQELCQKWGIGYADVFNDSEFNTYLERYNQYTATTSKYPSGDYVHPTKEGYELFYLPLIEDAIYDSTKKKNA